MSWHLGLGFGNKIDKPKFRLISVSAKSSFRLITSYNGAKFYLDFLISEPAQNFNDVSNNEKGTQTEMDTFFVPLDKQVARKYLFEYEKKFLIVYFWLVVYKSVNLIDNPPT